MTLVKLELIYLQQVNMSILSKKNPYSRKDLFRLTSEITTVMHIM